MKSLWLEEGNFDVLPIIITMAIEASDSHRVLSLTWLQPVLSEYDVLDVEAPLQGDRDPGLAGPLRGVTCVEVAVPHRDWRQGDVGQGTHLKLTTLGKISCKGL